MTILRESPWYKEILEEGRALGLEEGLEQGLEQGLERAREARRQDLLEVLNFRFQDLPADLEDRLQPLDLDQLGRLFVAALNVNTLDEFLAQLPPATNGSDGNIGPSQ